MENLSNNDAFDADSEAGQQMLADIDTMFEENEVWVTYNSYGGLNDMSKMQGDTRYFSDDEAYEHYMNTYNSDAMAANNGAPKENTGFGDTYNGTDMVAQLDYEKMAKFQECLKYDPMLVYAQDWRMLEAEGLDPRLAYDSTYIAEVQAAGFPAEMMFM